MSPGGGFVPSPGRAYRGREVSPTIHAYAAQGFRPGLCKAAPPGLKAPSRGHAGFVASPAFVHTGSDTRFDSATAVGFSVAWPHATSSGSFA
jgi:hypothetical protein